MKNTVEMRRKLFNHLCDEHDLVLFDSELDEIIRIVMGEPKQSLLSRFMEWVRSLDIYVPTFPVFE